MKSKYLTINDVLKFNKPINIIIGEKKMKCWICHKEMENINGGYYRCNDCRLLNTEENNTIAETIKQSRHEICEEIRRQFDNEYYWCYGDNNKTIVIDENDFNIILNQIEKGEE